MSKAAYPSLRRMNEPGDTRECPVCGAVTGQPCLEPDWTEIQWFEVEDHKGRVRGRPLK